jgi:hypothetical protein
MIAKHAIAIAAAAVAAGVGFLAGRKHGHMETSGPGGHGGGGHWGGGGHGGWGRGGGVFHGGGPGWYGPGYWYGYDPYDYNPPEEDVVVTTTYIP